MSARSFEGLARGRFVFGATFLTLLIGSVFAERPLSAQCAWRERPFALQQGNTIGDTAFSFDVADNAYVGWVGDGQLAARILGPTFEVDVPISPSSDQSHPSFASTALGATYLVYTESGTGGQRVLLSSNGGGQFSQADTLSFVALSGHAPLVIDSLGVPHVAWVEQISGQPHVMYWNPGLSRPMEAVANAVSPALAVDANDVPHILCLRSGSLLQSSRSGGSFTTPTTINGVSGVTPGSLSLEGTFSGDLVGVFESGETIYVVERGAGNSQFGAPRPVASEATAPSLDVAAGGETLIAFVTGGDIQLVRGPAASLGDPEPVTNTPEVEEHPRFALDSFGNAHGIFVRGSDVIYASDVCPPQASFFSGPTEGTAPFDVRFTSVSTGTIARWKWDFGDGSGSSLASPLHTFNVGGTFTVELTVYAPGGWSHSVSSSGLVTVAPPLFRMRIPDQLVRAGQDGVWFPVQGDFAEPLEGFQILAHFDPAILSFKRSDLARTSVEFLNPEFYESSNNGDLIEIGCVFDILTPIDGRVLAPGLDRRLTHLVFDVDASAPRGSSTSVELLVDDTGSRILSTFAIDGISVRPVLEASEVRIATAEQERLSFFIRGDFDHNSTIDLSDPIAILNFLFIANSDEPVCFDAADVNDVGTVDISSAISLLNFLFIGGNAPAVPYPSPGLDPTDDELLDCE